MVAKEEKINNLTNQQFDSLIQNWNNIAYKDKQKILSHLDKRTTKSNNLLLHNEKTGEIPVTKKNKDGKVKVDLKKLTEAQILPEVSANLSKILRQKETGDVLKYANQFTQMSFYESIEKGSTPLFEKESMLPASKQEILTALSLALEQEQKKVTQHNSITTKLKLKEKEMLMGKKTQKLMSNFMTVQKRSEEFRVDKTSLKQQADIDITASKQKVKFLKDVKQYLEQEKTTSIDLHEYNESVEKIYNIHRNKLVSLYNSQKEHEDQKKSHHISTGTSKEEGRNLQDSINNLDEGKNSKEQLREPLLGDKESPIQWKKGVLSDITHSVSHLISSGGDTNAPVPKRKTTLGQSRNI